jgi:hypothetical protein
MPESSLAKYNEQIDGHVHVGVHGGATDRLIHEPIPYDSHIVVLYHHVRTRS